MGDAWNWCAVGAGGGEALHPRPRRVAVARLGGGVAAKGGKHHGDQHQRGE